MEATTLSEKQLSLRFLFCIFCYFGLHILLRVAISDSLDYDEAEQALLSQWLRPGYTEQPPLYTWIQYYLFQIFGKTVFAVSLLKNSLLCLTYICLFYSARILFKDSRIAILAACSLLLIPQIGWESQRDMTHTTLVVFAASATLLQCLRMLDKHTITNYLLLGTVLSVGILAKVNFALFVLILFCSLLTFATGRRFLFSPKMVLLLLIIIILTGPYHYWMYSNQDIVFSATQKFERAAGNYYFLGIASLISNSFLFLTPLWLVYLLIFPSGFALRPYQSDCFQHKFTLRYILIFLLIMATLVLLFKVTYVKDRWLQPILFVTPLFFFSRLDPVQISPKKFRLFLIVICLVAALFYSAFAMRVVGASYIEEIHRKNYSFTKMISEKRKSGFIEFSRMNYPFTKIAASMKASGFSEGLIISNNRFIAGNMYLQFPTSAAIVPNYRFEDLVKTKGFTSAVIVWKGDYFLRVPKTLVSFMKEQYNLDPRYYPVSIYRDTYKYGRNEKVTLAAIYITLPHIP